MAKWHSLDEFDYGTGDILLLMKADPKKKVWRREQGLQPEGKDYKVRDEVVSKSAWTKEQVVRTLVDGDQVWETGHVEGRPSRREGDRFCMWHMSRTAWDSVVAWMWKRDLIEDFLKDSQ